MTGKIAIARARLRYLGEMNIQLYLRRLASRDHGNNCGHLTPRGYQFYVNRPATDD